MNVNINDCRNIGIPIPGDRIIFEGVGISQGIGKIQYVDIDSTYRGNISATIKVETEKGDVEYLSFSDIKEIL